MSTAAAPTEPRAVIALRAFLTMRPTGVVAGTALDSERGLLFVARDTSGLFPNGFSAAWIGPEAAKFYEEHAAELKPGRCVDLEIYHVRPVNAELRARVKSCALAPLPPSWIAHEEKLRHQPQENQPA
ncbi:MAG: hypothetical protein V4757_02320 [Pseudomonadota bacterium]